MTAPGAGPQSQSSADLFSRLKSDLALALSRGDADVVRVLRTLLAALSNAEAVELDPSQPRDVVGWAEVPRRRLEASEVADIIRREAQERRAAAAEYEAHDRRAEAERLRQHARLVERYLEGPD